MTVQTQLGRPRRVAAHFEKQRAEVRIIDVEVVMIDVNRLVASEQELPVDLPALESLDLLLRQSHEYHPIADLPFPPEIVGDIILTFLVVELVEGNAFPSVRTLTAWRNFSVTCPSTTGEGTGLPSCSRINVTNPPDVASGPTYPFKYNRSRHSTSNVTCPSSSSGMLAMPLILRSGRIAFLASLRLGERL